jgi:hypothetical protein
VRRRDFPAQPRDRLTDDRQLLCNGVAKRLIAQKTASSRPLSSPTLPGRRAAAAHHAA